MKIAPNAAISEHYSNRYEAGVPTIPGEIDTKAWVTPRQMLHYICDTQCIE